MITTNHQDVKDYQGEEAIPRQYLNSRPHFNTSETFRSESKLREIQNQNVALKAVILVLTLTLAAAIAAIAHLNP